MISIAIAICVLQLFDGTHAEKAAGTLNAPLHHRLGSLTHVRLVRPNVRYGVAFIAQRIAESSGILKGSIRTKSTHRWHRMGSIAQESHGSMVVARGLFPSGHEAT
jgi:hypothetical protein